MRIPEHAECRIQLLGYSCLEGLFPPIMRCYLSHLESECLKVHDNAFSLSDIAYEGLNMPELGDNRAHKNRAALKDSDMNVTYTRIPYRYVPAVLIPQNSSRVFHGFDVLGNYRDG